MSQPDLITIFCRRCRAEITSCALGSLVSCLCRVVTRATITHAEQPRTRITCRVTTMGFQIFFVPGAGFESIFDDFKSAIPKKTRTYVDGHWHVAKRSEQKLESFLASATARAIVVREKSAGAARVESSAA